MPEHPWPESHAEQTDVLAPITMQHARPHGAPYGQPPNPVPPEQPTDRAKARLRKAGIIAGAVAGVLAVVYVVDLLLSSGEVPRGVTASGVDIGGMSRADAEQRLRQEIEPRLGEPVALRVGEAEQTIDPGRSGLTLDWQGTLDRAGDQPLNPFTRLISLFDSHEVGLATTADDAALTAAVEELKKATNQVPTEGGIKFDGTTPVPVDPKPGHELDVDLARQTLIEHWADGEPVVLPVRSTPVRTTPEGVRAALEQIAVPAMSGPVTVHGDGKDAKLEPAAIAPALIFEPGEGGNLTVKLDQPKLVAAAQPQLASTEQEGRDAEIVFSGGSPTVQPSKDGRAVDWDKTFAGLIDVLKKTDGRELQATYTAKPAKMTTAAAKQLGIKEVIGEFTTKGFAVDSGKNIRAVAREVDGVIVKPGETFSLNGHTGPRTAAQGYVEAGVIKEGAPSREVGGGISQFATTLYNAAYFAGLKDAGHREHSYYISRYPAAREATVFQNHDGSSVIDLKFTNDSSTGVAIQAVWTPSSITVRIWGTKRYVVESVTGGRTDFTEPPTKPGPEENCHASNGAQGFTTSDTRVIKDASTGRVISRNTRTVRYNPQPKIVCGTPPA